MILIDAASFFDIKVPIGDVSSTQSTHFCAVVELPAVYRDISPHMLTLSAFALSPLVLQSHADVLWKALVMHQIPSKVVTVMRVNSGRAFSASVNRGASGSSAKSKKTAKILTYAGLGVTFLSFPLSIYVAYKADNATQHESEKIAKNFDILHHKLDDLVDKKGGNKDTSFELEQTKKSLIDANQDRNRLTKVCQFQQETQDAQNLMIGDLAQKVANLNKANKMLQAENASIKKTNIKSKL